MPILAAYCVPHPPLIIPEVGRGEEQKIHQTTEAFRRVAREIAALHPDTVILTSPHMTMYQDYFHIAPGKGAHGDLRQFGAPGAAMEVSYDEEMIRQLSLHLAREGFPAGTEGVRNKYLDHASFVPLYFIRQESTDFDLVRVGLSGLDLASHYELGMHIQNVADRLGRRCVIVASGDLSHRLTADGPYGFHPSGPRYDQKIMAALSSGDFGEILAMDPVILEGAGECGHRSFAIMAGCLDRLRVKAQTYSYEGPFGVGYGIAAFLPEGPDASRNFLDQYLETAGQDARTQRDNASPLVRLALAVMNARLNHQRFDLNDYLKTERLPEEFLRRRAGVFVSLKKNGQLRGCIGTIAPTSGSIAAEVVRNAVEAAFADPRFEPLKSSEFDQLACSVDVLSPAEPIASLSDLDPLHYGVIVTKGPRRGLLLPNLPGVDTVEEQLRIARSKAGIGEEEHCDLERFKVVRYE